MEVRVVIDGGRTARSAALPYIVRLYRPFASAFCAVLMPPRVLMRA